jgi:hypothetical protein
MTPPTYGQRVISRQQFRTELSDAVRIAINVRLQGTDPSDAQVRAELQDLKDAMTNVSDVTRDDPATISGVQLLASLSFITTQEATDLLYVTPDQPPVNVPCPDGWVAAHIGDVYVWAIQMVDGESILLADNTMCEYPNYQCMVVAGGAECIGIDGILTIDGV